jgi:hypothetical protein
MYNVLVYLAFHSFACACRKLLLCNNSRTKDSLIAGLSLVKVQSRISFDVGKAECLFQPNAHSDGHLKSICIADAVLRPSSDNPAASSFKT